MHAPAIPLYAWWIISIAATLAFLIFFVTLMPTRKYKIQVCFAPVLGVAFGVASALLKDIKLEELLPMYSTALLVFPIGVMGHRREIRQKILNRSMHGEHPEDKPSRALTAQLTLSLVILGALMAWLTFT
ncbi:hypothetical protein AB0I22_07155 [Streptomyces sp. NPDC050610]|uniref:hypothetical protein n=1 Tax=Streptomyces sp. NPDC050610 TaxID=3157097 RepID=UPI003434246B